MAPALPPSTTGSCTTISCTDCVMLHTEACDDCVVTFICDRAPDDAVVIDVAEARAVRLLASAGLVPQLRHQLRHQLRQEGAAR